MLSFFKNILKSDKNDYDAQREKLARASLRDRADLASSTQTHPEILYYLAQDDAVTVRRAIAANKATPVQAAPLLAQDRDVDVRLALAARLVDLLPDISSEKHSKLYAYAVQALGTLAQDEVLKIRRALSTALKDCAQTPPQVAAQLARDVEREVSEPILRFCTALADDDLLDILSDHPDPWVIAAIAGRSQVSAPLSTAVVKTGDTPATSLLLRNMGATFTQATLKKIVEKARDTPEWHAPLALRRELSSDMAQRIADFADDSIRSILETRADFDTQTRREIADMTQRRIAYKDPVGIHETAADKLERHLKTGSLTAEILQDALAWKDEEFIALSLAYLAKIHPLVATKMLNSGSARPLIALCSRAEMPMRLAVALQRDLAKLPPKDMIYARGGTDYPLSDQEIKWQLEFYGVR